MDVYRIVDFFGAAMPAVVASGPTPWSEPLPGGGAVVSAREPQLVEAIDASLSGRDDRGGNEFRR